MGIRFNRIESVEGNGNIINVEKNGEAIVVGRARRPQTLNLFRFDQNQIFNKSF